VLGVAVADAVRAPPETVTVTWSELEHVVVVDVAVSVKVVVDERIAVAVLIAVGLVTCAAGVQL
jgi:hypothetical protein